MLRPSALSATIVPVWTPSVRAVAGAMAAALPQTILVSGRGSSCSHAFVARLPSRRNGSAAKRS